MSYPAHQISQPASHEKSSFVFNRASLAALLLLGLALIAPFARGNTEQGVATVVVGEVTLVIGTARVIQVNGQALLLDKGTVIRVGDRIETAPGGHVHLKFVDGGRVSVRPASRLSIENYEHSASQPSLSAIKFRLDEGVVRSITGTWGEVAKDRFRLNTPVAAIGVKGTDFTVQSNASGTSASVYTGAIVLAPLASGCQTTLGPCVNGLEKLLSADMKGLTLQLDRQHAIVQFAPLADSTANGRVAVMAGGESRSRTSQPLATEVTRSDIGSDKVISSEVRAANAAANLSPVVTQLAWGRWTEPMAGDAFSQTYTAARVGREGTVGNLSYGLYREIPEGGSLAFATSPAQLEGVVQFRLAHGAAQFLPEGRSPEAAHIDSATLGIDFTRATYTTQLTVSSLSAGINPLQSNGVLLPNGIFQSRSGNAFVAGALTADGKEAGYFFEAAHPVGSLNGVTLWGR